MILARRPAGSASLIKPARWETRQAVAFDHGDEHAAPFVERHRWTGRGDVGAHLVQPDQDGHEEGVGRAADDRDDGADVFVVAGLNRCAHLVQAECFHALGRFPAAGRYADCEAFSGLTARAALGWSDRGLPVVASLRAAK